MRTILSAFPASVLFTAAFLCLRPGTAAPQSEGFQLTMDRVMTAQEFRDSGVSGLSGAQRKVLDSWLNRYTENIVKVVTRKPKEEALPSQGRKSDCVPAVESTIAGDFNGWDGETMFKLDNGQIWEQAEYEYMYSYAYRPDVTIYQTSGGCRMKVEDEEDTILVRRIK